MRTATNAIKLRHLYTISDIVTRTSDWKTALVEISQTVRTIFIFDNLVVYLIDPHSRIMDVIFARAMGRGKKAGADSAWGEILANQVVEECRTIVQEGEKAKDGDRLLNPYLLGIPLHINRQVLGALIFVRFGGPRFIKSDIQLAEMICQQIAMLVEKQYLQADYERVMKSSQQYLLQEDFISTISHELRNPLGFIKGYTTTLLRTDTSWDNDVQSEFLRIIDQETDYLQQLIDNLLDSSRLQTGLMKMKFQPVRLDILVKDVAARLKLHNPGINVSVESPVEIKPIQGDTYRLTQVVENLITNAIKYAPGSNICVKIIQDALTSVMTIEDHGPGIPEKYLPFIFDRFFRNPELSPNARGTGLGLYICRQIVQAHAGQIGAESIVGKGTNFKITLPNHGDI